MNLPFFISTFIAQKVVSRQASTRVCLHLLSIVRTDVRGMRAATALREAGFDVCIVDIEGAKTLSSREEIIQGVSIKHVAVPEAFISTRFQKWIFVRAALMFVLSTRELLRTRVDVYHALDLPALPTCYIAALLRRKPLIFEAYELPLSTHALADMSKSRHLLQVLLKPLLAYILPRCAGIITVSPPLAQELRRVYGLSEVTLVRNILPYQQVRPSNRLRERLALSSQTRIVLYQGNLQADRRLDLLVQAAAFLPTDVVVVLLGKPVGSTINQLRVLIEEQGLQERVYMVPVVPYEELLEWTASADLGVILCSPDYSRNIEMLLPNKLFEYLMAGLPVLASALPAIVEVINRYRVGGVVNSLAPRAIAQAIVRMLADAQELALMREHALIAARDELHWQKEQAALLQLYQNIGKR